MSAFRRFRKSVPVERRVAGAYVNGVWAPGAIDLDVTSIVASVQPATREDLQRLPEGQRITGVYKLFTNDRLLLARDDQSGDRVQIGGDWYLVTAEEVWDNGLIPHYAYLVTRIVEGTA